MAHNLLVYFQYKKKDKILNYLFVILIVSLFSGITGAYWDITYHALNEVDDFFQPAHLVIYSSLFLVFLIGVIITIICPKNFLFAVILACQLLSGYFDFLWHDNFGFDSFLSPPHVMLSFIPIVYSFQFQSLNIFKNCHRLMLILNTYLKNMMNKISSIMSIMAIYNFSVVDVFYNFN